MIIRKFMDSDAAEVARLHRGTIRRVNFKDYTYRQIQAWSSHVTAKGHREFAKKGRTRFVAVEGGKIIAFGDFKDDMLTGLYVHKDYVSKGVGKKLLEKLEKEAFKRGVRKFSCASTITAKEFYKKLGYRVVKKTEFEINGELIPIFDMVKPLKY